MHHLASASSPQPSNSLGLISTYIQLPDVFRQVVEETLRHFFDAIQHKRDQEQSWKKAIYKLIARLDQEVPEVFKTDAFNEHLE